MKLYRQDIVKISQNYKAINLFAIIIGKIDRIYFYALKHHSSLTIFQRVFNRPLNKKEFQLNYLIMPNKWVKCHLKRIKSLKGKGPVRNSNRSKSSTNNYLDI